MTDTTETIDNIMKPVINLNGTSAKMLVHYRVMTREALRQAMTSLAETRPHGRDYCGDRKAYEHDFAIYTKRFALLDKLYNELGDEAVAIQERATR